MYKCPAELNNNESNTNSVQLGANADVVADRSIVEHPSSVHHGLVVAKEVYTEYLDHPVLVWHNPWTSASTSLNITTNLINLYDTQLPVAMANRLSCLFFFKATIRIKVVVQGQAQSYGQGVLTFTPWLLAPTSAREITSVEPLNFRTLVNAKIAPHLVIDPSKTATYEIDLPVCTPNGVYCFDPKFSYGSYAVDFNIFNPVSSGTAVAGSCNICMYMSLVDAQFDGLTATTMTSSVATSEVKLSNIADGLTSISNYTGTVFPVLGPFTTLFSTVSSATRDVLKFLGFGRPPTQVNQAYVLNRTCDAYSQQDGATTAIVLANSTTTGEAISPGYMNGSLDDMLISKIISQPGLILHNFAISSATAAGAKLTEFPVSPMTCIKPTTTTFLVTPIAGVALAHSGWRGDLTYTFEFVASVFHRATVVIAWDPYAVSGGGPQLNTAMTALENVTVNISGNTVVEVTVPYKQTDLVLRASKLRDLSSDLAQPDNGEIYVYLVNPVLSNGSTDPIYLNVYISSKNSKFLAPTGMHITEYTTQMTSMIASSTDVRFGTASDGHAGPGFMPDSPTSVKEIMRRHCEYYIEDAAGVTTERYQINFQNVPYPACGRAVAPLIAKQCRNTLVGWFSQAYLGFRGSLSWSFLNWNPTSTAPSWTEITHHTVKSRGAIVGRTVYDETHQEDSYAYTQPNLFVSSRGDVIAPRFTGWYFTPTRYKLLGYKDSVTVSVFNATSVPTSKDYNDVILAAGDDFVLGWFLGFPLVYIDE